MKVVRKNGKTIEIAVQLALEELGVERDQVEINVIEQPVKGVLGLFGNKDAVVEVCYHRPEAMAEAAPEAPAETTIETTIETAVKTAAEAPTAGTPGADAIAFLTPVFQALNIEPEYQITEQEGIHWITFQGKGLGVLIGRRGETLDALQYLTNLAVNRQFEEKNRIVLDVEGYRATRAETLTNLARKMANKARRSHRDVMLEPMSPHERRVIHMALQNEEDIRTVSVGEEPYRKVIIKLIGGETNDRYARRDYNDNRNRGRRGGSRGYNRRNTESSSSAE